MVINWLGIGLLGWAALCIYRGLVDGIPKGVPLSGWIRGFLLSLVMGPLCFVFLCMLAYGKLFNDKTVDK